MSEKHSVLPSDPVQVPHDLEMQVECCNKTIKIQMIRIELDSGETEILVTSRSDRKKYPYELFREWYYKRWPVEEDYKAMKYRIEVKNLVERLLIPSIFTPMLHNDKHISNKPAWF